jgi:hypothetical protein
MAAIADAIAAALTARAQAAEFWAIVFADNASYGFEQHHKAIGESDIVTSVWRGSTDAAPVAPWPVIDCKAPLPAMERDFFHSTPLKGARPGAVHTSAFARRSYVSIAGNPFGSSSKTRVNKQQCVVFRAADSFAVDSAAVLPGKRVSHATRRRQMTRVLQMRPTAGTSTRPSGWT